MRQGLDKLVLDADVTNRRTRLNEDQVIQIWEEIESRMIDGHLETTGFHNIDAKVIEFFAKKGYVYHIESHGTGGYLVIFCWADVELAAKSSDNYVI